MHISISKYAKENNLTIFWQKQKFKKTKNKKCDIKENFNYKATHRMLKNERMGLNKAILINIVIQKW